MFVTAAARLICDGPQVDLPDMRQNMQAAGDRSNRLSFYTVKFFSVNGINWRTRPMLSRLRGDCLLRMAGDQCIV